MSVLRAWLGTILLSFLLVACNQNSSSNPANQSPSTGSAAAPVAFAERRVGIVYSDTSAQYYFDEFAYGQLYTAMQHQAMQAGVPYDLLTEDDLTDPAKLEKYGVLIIPAMSHVKGAIRDQVVNSLMAAQEKGLAIISSAIFMELDENNISFADSTSAMRSVLGIVPVNYYNKVAAQINVTRNDHPITARYQTDELIDDYPATWFAEYDPIDPAQATTLVEATVANAKHKAVQILQRPNRVVHFANDEFLADNNLLWSAIRWALYEGVAPVSLLTSREASVFIARNDMDQAMIASQLIETEIPLLEFVKDWKRDFNFVGSYYIDIGNQPERGVYTDWSVSAPLYAQYLALDNEFGTHSWTHPHYTSKLNDTQLEFEFNQSKNEISKQLGINVIGGAVPGNPENLNVVENLNQWFEYFSGRSITGSPGYRSGIGFLQPDHDMRYFNLNMTPDFGLIDFQNKTPEQSIQIWQDDFDDLELHAEMPVMHWLWHDYGPTSQAKTGRYSVAMFEETIDYAYKAGSEFVTLADYHYRLNALESTVLSTGVNGSITANVEGSGLGQFALKLDLGDEISSVSNWYAYSKDTVFIPDDGGEFTIVPGTTPADVSRISALPMRARLTSVNGNANEVFFSFTGQGDVEITLSKAMQNNFKVSGADSFVIKDDTVILSFVASGEHTASITSIDPVNSPPVSSAGAATTSYSAQIATTLSATDPNEDVISYRVIEQPANGVLLGTAPNLIYMPNDGFTGVDTFTFVSNDGALDSAVATFTLTVGSPAVANSAPVANKAVYSSVADQNLNVVLTGADNEGQNLQYTVVTLPANGTLTGTPPNLVYKPAAGFVGKDEFTYQVSDGELISAVERVVFNVTADAVPINGTVSNVLSDGFTVDAQLSDWADLRPFSVDPKDVSLAEGIDWKQAWMGHDANSYFIAFEQYQVTNVTWRNQIYIDADTNKETGFVGFANEYPLGADYVIEGNTILEYSGDGREWKWNVLGSSIAQASGNVVEIAIPRVLLGDAPNLNIFFAAVNVDNTIDFYPDDVTNSDAVDYSRVFSYSTKANADPENAAPVANALLLNTANNADLPIVLVGYDLNNDNLSYAIRTEPSRGTLTGVPPAMSYMPNAGFVGTDSFTFTVNDGTLSSNTATVILNVVAPPVFDSIPVAHNKSIALKADTTAAITLSGSDFDGGALTFTIAQAPTKGTLTGTAPQLVYTPNAGFNGTDTFSYTVNDGKLSSELATVSIVVEAVIPPNVAPVADNLSLTTEFETSIGIVLSGSDADDQPLSFRRVSDPITGMLTGTGSNLTYTPALGASGIDSFQYVVNDGVVDSAPANVSINIKEFVAVNLEPSAIGKRLETAAGQPLNIELTGIDPEQTPLNFVIVENPLGGTLSGIAPNMVYTPNAGFEGVDQLQFEVNDGELSSTAAIITINVTGDKGVVISNPVTSMAIDGKLRDWSGLTPFENDPDDASGWRNRLNWLSAMMAHDDDNLYFAFRNDGWFALSWGHSIRIDVDGDMNTGFRDFNNESPIGADFLIEGNNIHAYTGSGNDWSWSYVGTATSAKWWDVLELAIPRSLLGNPENFQMYLRANNEPFGGNVVDYYPDKAADANASSAERVLRYSTAP